jgi:predicted TIM-barrel fold metal-dependent hydrolase
MPLQDHHKLISTDDHIIEPPNVWTSRLPQRHRELGPRIVEHSGHVASEAGIVVHGDKMQIWMYEGRPYPNVALNAVAGLPKEEWALEPIRLDRIRPGCYNPNERVKDMDIDGVHAQLGFPTFPGFAGKTFVEAADKDLALLCVQAWNDFCVDEWCGSHPDRLIPLVIAPLWDPHLAADELRRTAAKGAKALAFPENPAGLGLPSLWTDHWDPLLAVAEETEIPLAMHFGTSTQMPYTSPDAPFIAMIPLMGTNSMNALSEILFMPMLHKFPRLKISFSEGGIGWIPWLLARIDYTWERHRFYSNVNREVRPSDLFRRNVWGCFIDDIPGIEMRHSIGIDRITWEGDYPHSDSAFPDSRKRAQEVLANVPDAEAQQIVELNARALLNWHR